MQEPHAGYAALRKGAQRAALQRRADSAEQRSEKTYRYSAALREAVVDAARHADAFARLDATLRYAR